MAGLSKNIVKAMTPTEFRAHKTRIKKMNAILKQGEEVMKRIKKRIKK